MKLLIFPIEFLHWKGYNAAILPNPYKHISTQDISCKGRCCLTGKEYDLNDYRQFAALTTLPRKNRSSQNDKTSRFAKGKGKLYKTKRSSILSLYYTV